MRPRADKEFTSRLRWWAAQACLLFVACAGPRSSLDPPPIKSDPPTVTIVAEDYRFQVPETVPAGHVRVRLTNQGREPHAAQLYRLDEGVTLERFRQAMDGGIAGEAAIATVAGGPANVDGGLTGSVEVVLEPGNYVVVCWVLGPGATPHAYRGMVDTFRVTDQGETGSSSEAVEGTIELTEYEIRLPDGFDGTGRFGAVNRGGEWHELVILELSEKQSLEDALAHVTGVRQQFPAPYRSRGGVAAMEAAGGRATINLDLPPGRYLFLCAIPGVGDVFHANRGMWTEVRIH